jgi:outer membrane protein OmpA-like peptidoglycan-associated protein
MLLRSAVLVFAALSLSACSATVSDRYAFWRDNGATASSDTKPNLGDVPAPPNVENTKVEMDTMKARLEKDRENAYLAAQGFVPIEDPANELTAPPAPVAQDELAPAPAMMPMADAAPLPEYEGGDPYAPVQQLMPVSSSSVQYNYAPGYDTYTYGYSNVQTGRQNAPQQKAQEIMASNGSVSIDMSALGGDDTSSGSGGVSPVGLSGQPLVYFKHGSYRLGSLDKKRIRELAQRLKNNPSSVVVIGHASKRTGIPDAAAAEDVNLSISAKRASVVMKELAANGVKPEQVKLTAFGDSAPNPFPAGMNQEDADRRVEILLDQ